MSAAAVQAPLPAAAAAVRNFYCHMCATEVVGLASAANGGEVECGQCHSNFVEAVGQGYETFVNPAPAARVRRMRPSRAVTTYTSHHGRDQRTPPLSPPPEANGFPGGSRVGTAASFSRADGIVLGGMGGGHPNRHCKRRCFCK